jgi:4'-phosphopantetheinyl transferase EntD
MPLLYREFTENQGLWGIWETTESLEDLYLLLTPNEPDQAYLDTISHPERLCQTLASRVLAAKLLGLAGEQYAGIEKDSFGKPFLAGYPYYISLSHTEGYAAVILHRHVRAGIDIEQVKEKLVKVAPRVFTEKEQSFTRNNLLKTGVCWCAKEAIFKMSPLEGLSLREIMLEDFTLGGAGQLTGQIQRQDYQAELRIFYRRMFTFIIAFCIDDTSQLPADGILAKT